jgi:chemotaxis protein CheX
MGVEAAMVTAAVETVWAATLGLEAKVESSTNGGRPKLTTLTGCIQITGAWQGAVTVECSGGLARRVASIMFGTDTAELTPDQVSDALGEMTNMIGGHIKALLPEPSYLSMPAVTVGTDYLFSVHGGRPAFQRSFTCEGNPFQITLLESRR